MGAKFRERVNPSGSISLRCDIHYKGARKVKTYGEIIPPPPPDDATVGERRAWKKERDRITGEAKVWRDNIAVDIAYSKDGILTRIDDGQLLLPFLKAYEQDYTGKGFGNVKATVKLFGEYMGAGAIWAHVDEDALNGYISHLEKKGMTSVSIVNYLGPIKKIITAAAKDRFTRLNIKTIKLNKPKGRALNKKGFLTDADIKAMSDARCDDIRVRVAFFFCCYTSLSFRDVYLLEPRHLAPHEYIDDKGDTQRILILTKPRSKTGEIQQVPILGPAQECLDLATAWGPYIFDLAKRFKPDNLNIEQWEHKYRSCYSTNNFKLETWLKAAGITKNINWHNARHSFASNIDAPLSTIKGMVGHADEKMTSNYQHQRIDRSITAVGTLTGVRIGQDADASPSRRKKKS